MRHARTSNPPSGYRQSPSIMLVAMTCAMAIAACGSSGTSPAAAGSNRAAQGIAFADCMRSHGVPNFPDPSAGGGGVQIPVGSGINPLSPAFQSAQHACATLLPGGGPGSRHPSERRKTELLQISECMRRHGVSGFPDPTLSPPSSPVGYSSLQDLDGVILAIPNTINIASPVFKAAAAICRFAP